LNDDSSEIKLSALAAAVLISEKKIGMHDLELLRPFEYDNSKANVPWDPVSSLIANATSMVSNVLMGVAAGPREAYKQVNASKARARDRHQACDESSLQSSSVVQNLDTDSESVPSEITELLYPQSTGSTVKRKALPTSNRKDNSSPETSSIFTGVANSSLSNHAPPTASASASSLNAASAIALESTKGIGHIITTSLKTPLTFTNGLTLGFHNLPTLYSDSTVRPSPTISGVKSGLVAAGKGFGYGLSDGLTGLVTQPYNGARKEGAVGFMKGVGKGISGVVCKTSAGACGIPGYAFMGVYREILKVGKAEGEVGLEVYLAKARIAQGEEEVKELGGRDWEDVVGRWGVEVWRRRVGEKGRE
jgi:hypothetical protein